MSTLHRTPFYPFQRELGARFVDFAGWELPVQYTGIIEEHRAVRRSVGVFDVSHMGELRIRGPRALDAVQELVTNDVASLVDGQALYTVMCLPSGGIVDDLIVYRLAADDYLLCVNAANAEKDYRWALEHNPFPEGAEVLDESAQWAQLAVQGRNAQATLQALTELDLSSIRYYHFARGSVAGVEGCIVARTGYTGEDGFEVFLPPEGAGRIWPALLEAGEPHGIVPVGLGARDTLRLEAGYCLYGNDITEETTPLEARLGWVVKLDKPSFIGKQALVEQKERGLRRRLASLVVEGRIARHGHAILKDGERVGFVTSGTRSPSLGTNIAMGYVDRPHGRPGNLLEVDVRGRRASARVVKPPFYKRDY